MKTVAKLVMLLAVLAICMPAAGQGISGILIYSKTIKAEGAEAGDPIDDIYRETIRGYLILDVVYVDNEIVAINDAVQIVYGRDSEGKFAWYENHEFTVQRFDDGRNVLYSLAELNDVEGVADFTAYLFQGKARKFSRADPNEVPASLVGYHLGYNILADFPYTEMVRINLRLQRRWTNIADEEDLTIEEVYTEIWDWLVSRDFPLGNPYLD